MSYFDELKRAMDFLAEDPRTVFLGQAVSVPGTAMRNTLTNVPQTKLIELPVAEELQMGMTSGMAMSGFIPVSIYPRWNFLLCAMNQLVNHLDKLQEMAGPGFATKAIIRTSIGSERPLNPQCQHIGDLTDSVRGMCAHTDVIRLDEPEDIVPAYQHALNRDDLRNTILVEYGDFYNEK